MSLLRQIQDARIAPRVAAPKPSGPRFAAPNVRPEAWQVARQPLHAVMGRMRPPVAHTAEVDRVVAIPRRPTLDLDSPEAKAFALEVTARFARKNEKCTCAPLPCIRLLNPAQAWTLHEAPQAGGSLGKIGVGFGKTILDILISLAIPGVKLAVLLVPPSLVGQLRHEYTRVAQHFHVPSLVLPDGGGSIRPGMPVLHVIPYSRLSRPESTAMLSALKPDLIIADEAHRLKDPKSAGTSRVLRYFAEHPDTKLCAWSGTLTAKSIRDYAGLSAIALGESSPLPLDPNIVEEWSLAIDPIEWQAGMGALSALCAPGEALHDGFRRRLDETLGVTGTRAAAVDASIVLHERKPPAMSDALKKHLAILRGTWTRPDGEELVDILQVAKSARELACGFFYKWTFPRGEDEDLIRRWFEARAAWHKELREKLKRRVEHLDSPLLCSKAAIRAYAGYGSEPGEDLPTWAAETWPAWNEVRTQVVPYPVAEWVDDYLALDSAAWAKGHKGIVWCEHDAFGRRAAKLAGMPYYGGRQDDPDIRKYDAEGNVSGLVLDGKSSVFLSLKKYHEGTDGLQRLYATQLFVNFPSLAKTGEQALGRLHRIGFTGDEVSAYLYRHVAELSDAIDTAIFQAKYILGTLGTDQKLLAATPTWEP